MVFLTLAHCSCFKLPGTMCMEGEGLWLEASLGGNQAGILTFYGQLTKVNVLKPFELVSFPKRNPAVTALDV